MKLICKHCFHSGLYLEENITQVYPEITYDEGSEDYSVNTANSVHAITIYILRCANCDKAYPKEVTEKFLGIDQRVEETELPEPPPLPPLEEEEDKGLIIPAGWGK